MGEVILLSILVVMKAWKHLYSLKALCTCAGC